MTEVFSWLNPYHVQSIDVRIIPEVRKGVPILVVRANEVSIRVSLALTLRRSSRNNARNLRINETISKERYNIFPSVDAVQVSPDFHFTYQSL